MIKEGIHINAIYQHYKGDYYKIIDVAGHHEEGLSEAIVIYHKCDINGIFKSVRSEINGEEEIILQPWYRLLIEFIEWVDNPHYSSSTVPRFKFVKQLDT